MDQHRKRETFSAEELATVLSHFDLGAIKSQEEFARGSRRAPKLVIDCDRGQFLLKRRAKGRDELPKVAFTHQIQLYLASQNFPLPHLLGTQADNNSMFVMGGCIYEMFEYIKGTGYDGSEEATFNAGRVLGLYHKLLTEFQSDFSPPRGSYHHAKAIHRAVRDVVGSLPTESIPSTEELTPIIEVLESSYERCAHEADALGLKDWPKQIVHGDWHPGNMLFRDRQVVGVIDYDAARLQQRVIDMANGALQFSIIGGRDDPSTWPTHLDEKRFKSFLQGYDKVNVISRLELQAMPRLMCEAIIAEAVLPIVATGSFGRIAGFPFLQMVEKKVGWMTANAERLASILD